VIRGDPSSVGHIIQASGGTGAARQTISYSTERVVGNGSFGVVFQATCLETGETVSLFRFLCGVQRECSERRRRQRRRRSGGGGGESSQRCASVKVLDSHIHV